jgi:hypothetical protein
LIAKVCAVVYWVYPKIIVFVVGLNAGVEPPDSPPAALVTVPDHAPATGDTRLGVV